MASMTTLLSTYASLSAALMFIVTFFNEFIPEPIRHFITSKFSDSLSSFLFSDFTFIIEDRFEAVANETFRAVELYLPTIISPSTRCILIGNNDSNNITGPAKPGIPPGTRVIDFFEGMKLEWILKVKETNNKYYYNKMSFELKCHKKHKQRVMDSYLPHICQIAESISKERETLYLYSYNHLYHDWESTVFKHPSTFKTLAMEPELKGSIVKDLDMFMQRKKYFQSVGRAWKRGYLLYGPPGTGKSSLAAAMANYLRFHIYDLQLQGVKNDSDLRQVLTSTRNRSILLIEDIDCSTKSSHSRSITSDDDEENENEDEAKKKRFKDPGVTLSGLLNFMDGLWSSCGDERIVIFTTNHKEKLDPALLRPGRMDLHIYMGYCSPAGFKTLAASYLGIEDHFLFETIEDLIRRRDVSPAEVAQQLMKSDEPYVSLQSLIEFIYDKYHQPQDKFKFAKLKKLSMWKKLFPKNKRKK